MTAEKQRELAVFLGDESVAEPLGLDNLVGIRADTNPS